MSQKNKERVHLIYGILLSVLLAALGIALIVSCIAIYKSGDSPFTRESISSQFAKIAAPTYICLAAVIGGIALSLALPLEDKKLRPMPMDRVGKLRAKLLIRGGTCNEADKLARKILIARVLCCALCALSALPVIIYLANPDNFTADINGSVIALVKVLLPCAVFAFAVGTTFSYLVKALLAKEETLLKEALASSDASAVLKPDENIVRAKGMRVIDIVRITVFAVAAVFIILGITNGGMSDVLEKAIKICTECIGLG